jgi:ribosomal protein L2
MCKISTSGSTKPRRTVSCTAVIGKVRNVAMVSTETTWAGRREHQMRDFYVKSIKL